jgi:hypothetical protein
MQYCLPYLIEQVRIVKPEAIVALGATAISGYWGTTGAKDVFCAWELARILRYSADDHVPSLVPAAQPDESDEGRCLGGHDQGSGADWDGDFGEAAAVFFGVIFWNGGLVLMEIL